MCDTHFYIVHLWPPKSLHCITLAAVHWGGWGLMMPGQGRNSRPGSEMARPHLLPTAYYGFKMSTSMGGVLWSSFPYWTCIQMINLKVEKEEEFHCISFVHCSLARPAQFWDIFGFQTCSEWSVLSQSETCVYVIKFKTISRCNDTAVQECISSPKKVYISTELKIRQRCVNCSWRVCITVYGVLNKENVTFSNF